MRLDEKADTKWLARTVGTTVVVVAVIYMVLWWLGGALRPMHELRESVECQRNIHQLVRAFNVYADDYESLYPPATGWQLALDPYVQERCRRCPSVAATGTMLLGYDGYAMNEQASVADRGRIEEPQHVPLVFDSNRRQADPADGLDWLPRPGRHVIRHQTNRVYLRGNWIGYADGSARIRLDPEVSDWAGQARRERE